jgi:hypothetical protein
VGIGEKAIRKNYNNREHRTKNIENIKRRWIEEKPSITQNRMVVTIADVKITTIIVDTGNAPMTEIAIT